MAIGCSTATEAIADSPPLEETVLTAEVVVEADEATLEDGKREWGKDPGIGTTLSPTSMAIAGVASIVALGLSTWLILYRKPDGTVHPYDE
ncbi:MAG: hypothetical protein AAF266_12310 [Planctomycetota bacterium]